MPFVNKALDPCNPFRAGTSFSRKKNVWLLITNINQFSSDWNMDTIKPQGKCEEPFSMRSCLLYYSSVWKLDKTI